MLLSIPLVITNITTTIYLIVTIIRDTKISTIINLDVTNICRIDTRQVSKEVTGLCSCALNDGLRNAAIKEKGVVVVVQRRN